MEGKRYKLELVEEDSFEFKDLDLSKSRDVYEFMKQIGILKEPEEVMYLLCLNVKCELIGYFKVTRGSNSNLIAPFITIFKRIFACNASSFIVVHNHLSRDSEPSVQDLIFTKELSKISGSLGLLFLDHIIISRGGWYSILEDKQEFVN